MRVIKSPVLVTSVLTGMDTPRTKVMRGIMQVDKRDKIKLNRVYKAIQDDLTAGIMHNVVFIEQVGRNQVEFTCEYVTNPHVASLKSSMIGPRV